MAKLYHYTTAQGLVGMITDKALHFTHYEFMNDSSEHIYIRYLINEAGSDEVCGTMISFFDLINILDGFKYDLYIASFSHNGDSLPLWRNYAGADGICIGFNANILTQKHIEVLDEVIEYDLNAQMGIIKEIICEFKSQIEKHNIEFNFGFEYDSYIKSTKKDKGKVLIKNSNNRQYNALQLDFASRILTIADVVKHNAYKDEDEVRAKIIVAPDGMHFKSDQSLKNIRRFIKNKVSKNGVIKGYVNYEFKPIECIESIKLHPASTKVHKLGVEKFLRSKGFENVEKMVSISDIPFRDM